MASASATDHGSNDTKTTSDMYSLNDGAPSIEIDRLDEQHRVLLRPLFDNSLLPAHVASYLHQAAKARPVAVADIATGTSIWLRELAQELSANSRLDGFDMDTSKFLAPSKLPGNVKLHKQNFFESFPQECEGVYDVVHVRLIWIAVRGDQWTPLAQALKKLLRPGGWLVFAEGVLPCCETFPPDRAFQRWQMYLAELDQRKGRDPM
jgi:SAM-dependent methyltransferase